MTILSVRMREPRRRSSPQLSGCRLAPPVRESAALIRPSVALSTSAPFDSRLYSGVRCASCALLLELSAPRSPHLFAHFGVTFSREFRPVDALIPCRSAYRASACLPYKAYYSELGPQHLPATSRRSSTSRSFRPANQRGDVTALRHPSRLPAYRLDSYLDEQRTSLRLVPHGPSASRGEPATGHATRRGRAPAPECSQVAFRRRRTGRRLPATHPGPQRQC